MHSGLTSLNLWCPLAFDKAYYERYYYNARTSVTSAAEMRARARLIAAYADHVGLPVKRVLDMGCGIGILRRHLKPLFRGATYVAVDVSEYLCERYGWEQGGVTTYRNATPFDLVVCYDVVQYLDEKQAAKALRNLARLCRGVMYFGSLTTLDWRRNADRERTDANVHLHTGDWYRAQLRKSFHEVGAGFWVRKGAPLTLWDLETAG